MTPVSGQTTRMLAGAEAPGSAATAAAPQQRVVLVPAAEAVAAPALAAPVSAVAEALPADADPAEATSAPPEPPPAEKTPML